MGPLAGRFARAARRLGETPLSPMRRDRVARSAADFLACVAAGVRRTEAEPAIMLAAPGATAVFGLEARFDPAGAALVLGTAGALLQLHNVFPEGGNHPSSAVVPTVLALRLLSSACLEEAFGAIAAGYEIANRLALAGYPDQQSAGFTPTSIAGAIGAAAAAGLMLDLTDRQLAAAFGLVALTAPATPFQALREHGSATPLHGGLAARAGVEAALLARRGVEAGDHVLKGDADTPGWLRAVRLLPDRVAPETWDGSTIDDVVWKLFPSCFASHASIEAVLGGPFIDASNIVRVAIGLSPPAMTLVSEGPRPDLQLYDRLMSVRWSVAVALLHHRYDITVVDLEADRALVDLASKIATFADPELAALPQGETRGHVMVEVASGNVVDLRRTRALRGATDVPGLTGSTSDPVDPRLDAKIEALTPGGTSADLIDHFARQA